MLVAKREDVEPFIELLVMVEGKSKEQDVPTGIS